MEFPLTWRDKHGVVHAVVEESDLYIPPHALMLLCHVDRTWHQGRPDGRFGHVESGEIRAAGARETVTCFTCLMYCGA